MSDIQTNKLIFFVNGEKVVEEHPDPRCTLLYYLRNKLELRGTKVVCGEGGCGACTVMVSRYNQTTNHVLHYSVNACLMPVCSVHGLAVTTTEGIGSLRTRLHPVQEQIAKSHGSQCGFCTPGMVMSMYTLLRNNPQPTMAVIEKYLEGNLCRCTGYRPILDGCRVFSKEQCSMGENCCKNKSSQEQENNISEKNVNEYCVPYDPTQEPIFPPELKVNFDEYNKQSLMFKSNGVKWLRPLNLAELLDLKTEIPNCKIIVGNTEIGIETRFKNMKYPVLIDASNIPELTEISVTEDGVKFGASVTLSRIEEYLNELINTTIEEKCRVFSAVAEMLKWFAGKQIKNTACIGGNIITASPISDLNPIFHASTTVLDVVSKGKDVRKVPMDMNFFHGYRKTGIEDNEVVVSIMIPFTNENQYFQCYKQAIRKDDDTAIVNAGMMVIFEDGSNVIKQLILSYGGMAPTTVMATRTMIKLVGRKWESEIVALACKYLEEDLPLEPGALGGMVEYRRTLSTSFFFKFYLTVAQQLSIKGVCELSGIPTSELSGIKMPEFGTSKSSQFYESVAASQQDDNPIGRPLVHVSAYQQATGEAVFVDDMLPLKGELHVCPVYSSKPHATIVSIDPSAALQLPGVEGYIDYRDVPGNNYLVLADEDCFAENEVTCVGCLIGGIVAESSEIARDASRLVKIEYKDLPIILTIQDAIDNKSYWPSSQDSHLECGNVEASWGNCEQILEGEVYLAAQEHFYFETQSARAVPKERDEMDIFSATQAPTNIQMAVSQCLGVLSNKVKCFTKRVGGAFGGKESQCQSIAVLAAIAAKKFNKPARCILERDDDMVMTGGRHPILVKYKVGFSNEGRVTVLDIDLYANCGNTLDVSKFILENIMHKMDMSYKIPNFQITGYLCKTNVRSNTAMRAAGSIQSMYIMENIMQHVVEHLGAEPTKLREMNFYKEGDRTHINQIVKDCLLQCCWEQCLQNSDYFTRRRQVEEFNRENRWRKRGISILPVKYGNSFELANMNYAGALVNVYADGSVLLAHGGVEMGQGLYTKMIQVASATLCIQVDKIHTSETGTNTVPNMAPTAASVGSDMNGMAIKIACEKILKRLEPFKTEKGSTWCDWVAKAYLERVNLAATGFYKAPNLGYDPETDSHNLYFYYSFGAGCSEVEIDCLTGDHTVLRTDIVMDVGSSLNPAIDIGQIEGAFVQGYGLFMLENFKYSPSGDVITRGPGNYKIPSNSNIPREFNVSLLKGKPNKSAIYSSKCIGEPPFLTSMSVFLATKAAIMAARMETGIKGYFQLDSPATPDIIRMLCQDEFTKQFPKAETGTYQPWFVRH